MNEIVYCVLQLFLSPGARMWILRKALLVGMRVLNWVGGSFPFGVLNGNCLHGTFP